MSRHMRLHHLKVYKHVQQIWNRCAKSKPRNSSDDCLKGTNWWKNYVNKIDDNRTQCIICDIIFRCNYSSGNMKRHISRKHPYIFDKEINKIQTGIKKEETESDSENCFDEYIEKTEKSLEDRGSSLHQEEQNIKAESVISHDEMIIEGIMTDVDEENVDKHDEIETLSEKDPEFENKIKYLCNKDVAGRNKAKKPKPIWNFFSVLEHNRVYKCLACKEQLSSSQGRFSNLMRHISRKHKKQYEIMTKYLSEKEQNEPASSNTTCYFDKETDGQYKCKNCGDVLSCSGDNQEVLVEHFKEKHLGDIASQDEEIDESVDGFSFVIVKDV